MNRKMEREIQIEIDRQGERERNMTRWIRQKKK